MQTRLDPFRSAPRIMNAMLAMDECVNNAGLEQSLIELIKIRASQLNGCSYGIHLHTTDARTGGEAEARIYLLSAWQQSALYTPREKAALAWTDSLTRLAENGAPDAIYEELKKWFNATEQVVLTLLIGSVNTWNRLAVGFRTIHEHEKAGLLDSELKAVMGR